jgi:hypothetical protein
MNGITPAGKMSRKESRKAHGRTKRIQFSMYGAGFEASGSKSQKGRIRNKGNTIRPLDRKKGGC